MSGFDLKVFCDVFVILVDVVIVLIILFGYYGNVDKFDFVLCDCEKVLCMCYVIGEVVYVGVWKKSFDVVV